MNSQKPKVIDLFSGAGGFSTGFMQAGFNPIFAIDNWIDAEKTYTYNHPNSTFIRKDIREIRPLKILSNLGINRNEIDVIVGGPPCQGFSLAGKRNLGDPRNQLFKEFIKTINVVQPKILVMENVKGLLSMKTPANENVIDIVEQEFNDIGYNVTYKILNAAEYGVPQKRQRVIFIANSLGLENGTLFPKKTHGPDSKSKKSFVTVKSTIMDIAKKTDPQDKWNHKPMQHSEKVKKRFELMPKNSDLAFDQSFLPKGLRRTAFAHNCKRLPLDEPSVTLVPGHYAFPVHPTLPRTITVREAARLQTFPDNFIFFGKRDNQALLAGNAVPVKLAKAIAAQLKGFL